jgi:AcrR family transcriptional regulator
MPNGTKRSVGRPRLFSDVDERGLIFDAAYAALRDGGQDFTISNILATAGISTRSFYRHFESKDALLSGMYLRDAEWAAERLVTRLADAATPAEAVTWWIDEIFGFTRTARRAERVSVLGSITVTPAGGVDETAQRARTLLTAPLRQAIETGLAAGDFKADDVDTATELVAAAAMYAAGLTPPRLGTAIDQAASTAFCLRALGLNRGRV